MADVNTCLVCSATIEYDKKEDSVFCEGFARDGFTGHVLHGLPKLGFKSFSESGVPFFCAMCSSVKIHHLLQSISDLPSEVSLLKADPSIVPSPVPASSYSAAVLNGNAIDDNIPTNVQQAFTPPSTSLPIHPPRSISRIPSSIWSFMALTLGIHKKPAEHITTGAVPNQYKKTTTTTPCKQPKCLTCKHHLNCNDHFKSSSTGIVYPLRHRFTCTSSNVIYLITCTK